MNPLRRALLCSLLLLGAWPGQAAADNMVETAEPVTITGEISRGDSHAVRLFDDIEFQLRPIEHGWWVWVGDPAASDDNYAAIATPPFHGPNETVIEGWHFRNSDNTGPNEPGLKNVNFPQELRSFHFVIGEADYETARDALQIILWPNGASDAAIEAASARWDSVPMGAATLMITGLDLGNLTPGKRAWIERMTFTLTLRYP